MTRICLVIWLTYVAGAVSFPSGDANVIVSDYDQLPDADVIGNGLTLDLAEDVRDAIRVVAGLAPSGGRSLGGKKRTHLTI